ncbi:MAG: PHP domain-containing protein [Planctomycetes bacterium]|nr:PHP domain-containing protein [Planctomycetota bacterium]
MPAQQPFTALCRLVAEARPHPDRADLHLHTTHSDGSYTPAQVVELALRSGLCAIGITDHDTIEGVAPARAAAAGTGLEVIAGVEISTAHQGRELHLLGYFVSTEDTALSQALEELRRRRVERFHEMIERLREQGVSLAETKMPPEPQALGRRHLAELLVRQGKVSTVREAFLRYLHDGGQAVVPKQLLPVAEAIRRVRGAGGVASWAHPPDRCTREHLSELCDLGLGALEAEYPGFRPARVRKLRAWASELGLAVSGGSDCHGPDSAHHTVGVRSVSRAELDALRTAAVIPPARKNRT